MTIGNRVLHLLKEKGLKQKDLADYLHTKPSTVNGWKNTNRNPSCDLIIPICEFLGVSVNTLLTGNEEPASATSAPSGVDPLLMRLIFRLSRDQQIELRGYVKRMLDEPGAADEDQDVIRMAK